MYHQDTASDSTADLDHAAGSRFVLSFPAKAEFVALSRLTAASLGLIFELDAETLADLKIVLTEACSLVMQSGGSADEGPLMVEIHVDSNTWRVRVAGPRSAAVASEVAAPAVPMPETAPLDADVDPSDISLVLIQALADEVEFTQDPSGAIVRFTKRMS